ncbi:hypothetical protein ACG3SL_13020 [Sphingomonas sp. CJ20]
MPCCAAAIFLLGMVYDAVTAIAAALGARRATTSMRSNEVVDWAPVRP